MRRPTPARGPANIGTDRESARTQRRPPYRLQEGDRRVLLSLNQLFGSDPRPFSSSDLGRGETSPPERRPGRGTRRDESIDGVGGRAMTSLGRDHEPVLPGHRTRRIVLTGTIDAASATELVEHCRRLSEQGWRRLVIDVHAVTACDDPGLAGLVELHQGRSGLEVTVVGARWSQFMPALQAAPYRAVVDVQRAIRTLLDDGRRGARVDDTLAQTATPYPVEPGSPQELADRPRARATRGTGHPRRARRP